jgi:hypothetical protein
LFCFAFGVSLSSALFRTQEPKNLLTRVFRDHPTVTAAEALVVVVLLKVTTIYWNIFSVKVECRIK